MGKVGLQRCTQSNARLPNVALLQLWVQACVRSLGSLVSFFRATGSPNATPMTLLRAFKHPES
jgi:hypothetical protein